jgi:hypothetical protein
VGRWLIPVPASHADGKRHRLKTEAAATKSAAAGRPGARASSPPLPPPPRPGHAMGHGTNDVVEPAGSYPIGHTPSSFADAPIAMPRPAMFGGHTSPLAPISPRTGSPLRTAGRRDYHSTKASPHFARAHSFVEHPLDRTSGTRSSQPLPACHDHARPRGLSQTSLESLTDPAHQLVRYRPQPNVRGSTTSTSASSLSSNLSSSAATPPSTYASSNSMEDVRSQRSLPPLSTVGLEPLANPPYPEPSSQPHFSSPTYLPNSHTLPPPLHSPFLSSSSSGKPHIPQFRRRVLAV